MTHLSLNGKNAEFPGICVFMWLHVFCVALVVMLAVHLVLEVKEGTYSDSIVATITDNPDPVEFQLASIGALPKVP